MKPTFPGTTVPVLPLGLKDCDTHICDNLSTHSAGALYQTFPAEEARRLLRRLEFHYVPKHGSWLNMVEIEIGVLAAQCLDRRIESIKQLAAETAIWEQQRNAVAARVKWMFTTDKARAKMGHAYPRPQVNSDHTKRVKTTVQRYQVLEGIRLALGKRSAEAIGQRQTTVRPRND